MENTNNLLVNRQLEVLRNNLVTVFRFTVKALIDKACFSSVDDNCEEFINFSAAMEQVLHHRLRPSKMWHLGDNKNHFWFYIKAACHRHDLHSCINNIDNIENIRTPVGKGRAFLRCALMEKRLAEYLSEALKQTNVTRRFYQEGAIMLGDEATELCGVLVGLNSIDFGFCLKGENYDSVPVPLAVCYSPFMKFKQSPESLYSDMEEMRELSCGSSLASEDGQEVHDGTADTWQDRYNMLHKRYMRVLEQKSFLEELTSAQEKSLQMATAAQEEQRHLQQEAEQQHRQYEAVILELQAQVARMKAVNESLQRQLTLARQARSPIAEMEFRGESQVDASRFAAALAYRQDASEQNSLRSFYDRDAAAHAVDTRSLASAISEFSAEAVPGYSGTHAEGGHRQMEDSQSMVPLIGSLSDLHCTGHDIASISSILAETASLNANVSAVTEKAENVSSRQSDTGSVQSGASYSRAQSEGSEAQTSEEVNGNSLSSDKTRPTHTTDLDSSHSQLDSTQSQAGSEVREDNSERLEDAGDEGEGMEGEEYKKGQRGTASVWHDGLQESILITRGPSSQYSQEESLELDTEDYTQDTPSEARELGDYSEMTEDQYPLTSNKDELASSDDEGSSAWNTSDAQQLDTEFQQEDIANPIVHAATSTQSTESTQSTSGCTHKGVKKGSQGSTEETKQSIHEDTASDQEDSAQKSIGQETKSISEAVKRSGQEESEGGRDDTANGSDRGSEPEILAQETESDSGASGGSSNKGDGSDLEILDQEDAKNEGTTSSSDKGDGSDPEILVKKTASDKDGTESSNDKVESSKLHAVSHKPGDEAEGSRKQQEVSEEKDSSRGQGAAGDKEGTGSGSDLSGSDIAKDAWDMLSDANHYSS